MKIVLTVISYIFISHCAFAVECYDVVNGQERLACYDNRDKSHMFWKHVAIFDLWKVQKAQFDCEFTLDVDNFKLKLMMENLTWHDINLAPRSGSDLEKMNAEISEFNADKDAWCAKAMRQYGKTPDNLGYVFLRPKGKCAPY